MIEVVVASVVFLLGLSGLLGALVQARSATGQARRIMQATDIANDLSEQMQMWRFDDPRLIPSGSLCGTDPLDKTGKLLKPGTGDYNDYRACMHGEVMLTLGGAAYGGLREPRFRDNDTRFERFYIVQVTPTTGGGQLMQIWVKIIYQDAGEPRVVTTHAVRVNVTLGGA